jgi:FkbM family methyltransferase
MDHSLPISKAILRATGILTRPVTERISYTTRSGIAAGLKRIGGYGFLPRALTEEEQFYRSLDLAGKVVYDVGSYDGIFSLFAARAVGPDGSLVVFEPVPECLRRTRRNLELNHFRCEVILQNVALGSNSRSARMWIPSRDNARSTLNPEVASKYLNDGEKCVENLVQVQKLDDLVPSRLPIPHFVKIDTEAHEYEVLLGAEHTLRHYGPDLFIELHGTTRDHWIQNRRNLEHFVGDCGYSVFDMHHQPLSGTEEASHLYCKRLPN